VITQVRGLWRLLDPRPEEYVCLTLFAYCRENLSPQKTPRRWVFVDSFPMTASGKIQKFVLREQLLAQI
jgi:fatty-acyl-CoA synthase